ncbi:MAG: GC-type dockerin domain-anchored protein, partial [bacterium]
AQFFDAGIVDAPLTPVQTQAYLQVSAFDILRFDNTESLTVKWLRFQVASPVESPLYFDITTSLLQTELLPGQPLPLGLTLALYNASGQLVATDDRDGSFPEGFGAAGLSFGTTAWRYPVVSVAARGQDGPLQPGVYWLALAAGAGDAVTVGTQNWSIQTTASYPIGFFQPGTYYPSISFIVGNTIPYPPPVNDNCENAIVVGESPSLTAPVWTGTTRGATSDGQFPCWPFNNEEPFNTKDIWFRYIPSASGYAEISSAGLSGQTPMISRFDGTLGCGSGSLQCAVWGSSFALLNRTRILTPVTQGVPVLLALGMLGGNFGELDLRITLLPPPCNLGTPADAILESETNCSEILNNGCNADPFAFDQLQLGRAFAGRVAAISEATEQDWTEFTLPVRSHVTVTLVSQAPLWFEMWQRSEQPEDCYIPGTGIEFREAFYSNACVPQGDTAVLEPGVYRTLVAWSPFYNVDNLVCGTGYEGYWFRIDAVPAPPPCPADVAGPGQSIGPDSALTADDIIVFLNWFFASDDRADVAGPGQSTTPDGQFTADDIIVFLNRFFVGC